MTTNDEDRRQFRVVARVFLKLNPDYDSLRTRKKGEHGILTLIGLEQFGLSENQCLNVLTEARQDLIDFRNADRRRKAGMHNVPTDSDSLVALVKKKWERVAA